MAWSDDLQLICVLTDGRVFVFSLHGELENQFILGKESTTYGVHDCCISENYIVAVLETTHELVLFRDFTNPIRIGLAQPDLHRAEPPTALTMVINQDRTNDGDSAPSVTVILASQSGTMLTCDEQKSEDQLLTQGPFRLLAVSPDGQKLACFDSHDTLHCITRDFRRSIFEFGTNTSSTPVELNWCTNNAVVITFDTHLLLVGELGYSFLSFPYSIAARVFAEIDGVRVVTATVTEFIEQVPKSTESIFTIGSISPGAMLYDAAEALEKQYENVDEALRSLVSDRTAIIDAINTCLDAAKHEFDPVRQKRLLKAASVGKLCYDTHRNKIDESICEIDRNIIRDICVLLRVLNAVRTLSIPITYEQFMALTPDRFVDRLNSQNVHDLSLAICNLLQLDSSRVLLHWAISKVKHRPAESDSTEDKQLAHIIVQKLKSFANISLAPIASAAYRAHRPALALTLCEHEIKVHLQVPLLISMNEEESALDKAIESGDTDLVHLCLLHLRRSRSSSALFSVLRNRPLAQALLLQYAKQSQDIELLKSTLAALQMSRTAGMTAIEQAYQQNDTTTCIQHLQLAGQFLNQDKRDPFFAVSTMEHVKLLQIQLSLGPDSSHLVGKSVSETIEYFLSTKQVAQASKIQTMFKVPAKRFWHIQVQVYAQNSKWAALYSLVDRKKMPPVGYTPFIEACLTANNVQEAVRYIELLSDIAERMEWLCNIGKWEHAAKLAIANLDVDALQTIRANCNEQKVIDLVSRALTRLQG